MENKEVNIIRITILNRWQFWIVTGRLKDLKLFRKYIDKVFIEHKES